VGSNAKKLIKEIEALVPTQKNLIKEIEALVPTQKI